MRQLEAGDPIIYIPDHANGDRLHLDCERGNIVTLGDHIAHCRYYYKDGTLRTTANTEATPIANLVHDDRPLHVYEIHATNPDQATVNEAVQVIEDVQVPCRIGLFTTSPIAPLYQHLCPAGDTQDARSVIQRMLRGTTQTQIRLVIEELA